MTSGDFDPGVLLPPLRVGRRVGGEDRFVIIPKEWARRANVARALALGAPIWYAHRLAGREEVPLSNQLAGEFGIGRKEKYRLLRRLEHAGLVQVRRMGNKSPRVNPVAV